MSICRDFEMLSPNTLKDNNILVRTVNYDSAINCTWQSWVENVHYFIF